MRFAWRANQGPPHGARAPGCCRRLRCSARLAGVLNKKLRCFKQSKAARCSLSCCARRCPVAMAGVAAQRSRARSAMAVGSDMCGAAATGSCAGVVGIVLWVGKADAGVHGQRQAGAGALLAVACRVLATTAGWLARREYRDWTRRRFYFAAQILQRRPDQTLLAAPTSQRPTARPLARRPRPRPLQLWRRWSVGA